MKTNPFQNFVDLPKDTKPLQTNGFKGKTEVEGSIERYKAHLVTKGIDYNETLSPIMRFSLFTVVIAVYLDFRIIQLDVKIAFMAKGQEHKVLCLNDLFKQLFEQWYL